MPETVSLPALLLEKLWFYVNFDCNLACRYCVARSGPTTTREPLSLDIFRQLVDEAVHVGFRQIVVTGGEPLLNPHIPSMLRHAAARLNTLLLTNATLVSEDRSSFLREMSGAHLSMQVSLDSANPGFHDRLRGRGSWKRTVDGITRLIEWGFGVGVRATLVGQSETEVEGLKVFLASLGVSADRIYTVPVAKGGRSTRGLDLAPGDLVPEPVVAADGIYRHPFMIDPSMAVSRAVLPLAPALAELVCSIARAGESDGARRYR